LFAPNVISLALEDATMGDVAINYRLLPESPDVNLEELTVRIKAALPAGVKLHNSTTKPFAFGLSAIEILVVMKDSGGLSDQTEENLQKVDGIQSVELLEMSLI
jgi:elongation factor 1-beta